MGRKIAYAALGLLVLLLVGVGVAWIALPRIELAGFAAKRLAGAAGRGVTIESLHVTPGRWLTIDVRGARLANLPGGTRPDMVALVHASAEVEAMSLIHGPARVRQLQVEGATVLLEHVGEQPNWRNGAPKPRGPEDRSGFPSLRDVRGSGFEVTFRTRSGHPLVTRLDEVVIHTDSDDSPAKMRLAGAYQGVPVTLDADLQPIAVLRRADVPYGTDLRFASGDTTLRFEGTMTRPLDVDGADGRLTLHSPTMKPVLQMTGAGGERSVALDLAGALLRNDPDWDLADAEGTVQGSAFDATHLHLKEGRPDQLSVELHFAALDVEKLLAGGGGGGEPARLDVEREPKTLVDARVTADAIAYGRFKGSEFEGVVSVAPGVVKVETLSVVMEGAKLEASGTAEAADKGSRLTADATVTGADVQTLRRELGAGAVPLYGRLDARAAVQAAGETLEQAIGNGRVSAVISMRGGSIARDVVEKASADLRQIFRRGTGTVPVTCLLGVMEVRNGTGTLAPLRIRTAAGTLAGQGRIDLRRETIDLVVGSQSATTSDFALDIPFRISGRLANPSVAPSRGATLGASAVGGLPPELQRVARQNPCIAIR